MIVQDEDKLRIWFAGRMGQILPRDMRYIGCEVDGEIAFVSAFENFNGVSMYVHTASNGRGRLTKEFVWASFHYPFVYCKAQILIAPISSGNPKALRFNKHLGFKIEHIIKGAHPDGDLVYTTMRREECRFLSRNWGPRAAYISTDSSSSP